MQEALQEIAYYSVPPSVPVTIAYYEKMMAKIQAIAKAALQEQSCQTNQQGA